MIEDPSECSVEDPREDPGEDSSGDWLQVRVMSSKADAETMETWLFEAGALSVTLHDSLDDEQLAHAVLEPVPGEVRLWDNVTLVGLFAQDSGVDSGVDSEDSGVDSGEESNESLGASREAVLREALLSSARRAGMALPAYTVESLQDCAWERTWMDRFQPMQFGDRLWICPSHSDVVDPQAVNLKLDPGLAFGTGTHATTAQCLQWLGSQTKSSVTPLCGKTVVDFGCGSGVLAIAALLLGAEHAFAVDIDEQAIQATRENAVGNGVGERLSVGQPESLAAVQADVVFANILFKPLMSLTETLASVSAHGADLVMSGILENQVAPLRERYNSHFKFDASCTMDGWSLVTAVRR